MGIGINIGAGATNTNSRGAKADKPQATLWLNVGFTTQDPETGEDLFIGLPMGIPLDTMEVRSAGNSKLMQAKNALLQQLVGVKDDLDPGQTEIISDLQVQIRRVEEREAASGANNELIASMGALSFAKKAS